MRTPRIVLLHYQGGEMIAGHNAFRQLVLRRYWRQDNGKPAIPPVCHNTAATVYRSGKPANEANQLAIIDNCASGGRRIDLETCSLSYPLWRSDFNDIGQGLKGEKHWPLMGRANQVHVGGLSLYIPLHTGPLWSVTPYNVRSCMSGAVVLYDHIRRGGFPDSLARRAVAEVKELRPFFLGDFFPLMELTTQQSDWWAYQLDRPDLAQGVAFIFRRSESQRKVTTIALSSVDAEGEYEVSITGETYFKASYQSMRGDALRNLNVTIPEQPGSVLARYRRVKR